MTYDYVNTIVGSRGRNVKSRLDLIELSKRGIAKDALLRLGRILSLSSKEMAGLLHVSERTLQRYGNKEVLNQAISNRVVQILQVVGEGMEFFGEEERFAHWLKSKSLALGGATPLELMQTAVGTQMVVDELGRMEHGIVA
jgi:putative toxin-antitoxin system antitoxin component (TIGR02293 family)